MQVSAFLDVAVTLLSAYVLLSLLCTTLSEFITTLLRTRATTLKRSVSALLDDPNLSKAFFESGLIQSMNSSSGAGKKPTLPSYLSSRTFADALLGALAPGATLAGVAEVQKGIAGLQAGKLKDSLSAIVANAVAQGGSVRDDVARWFDDTMDRLNGSYVRYMKYFSLALGFAIALALNVDTLELATKTWNDRTSVVISEQLATKLMAQCTDTDSAKLISCQTGNMNAIGQQVRSLPVGWGPEKLPPNWMSFDWLLAKLLGLIVTAVAISLGSPLLFDLLQLIMSLRGAGTKPSETVLK